MTSRPNPLVRAFEFLFDTLFFFRRETGQSLAFWAFVAISSFFLQVIFRRHLGAGEFGTLNTILGLVGLTLVPLLALTQAFVWFRAWNRDPAAAEKLEPLRSASYLVTETFAWAWGILAGGLLFLVLPLIELPRFPLELLTVLIALVTLGGLVSADLCRQERRQLAWSGTMALTVLLRLAVAAVLMWQTPWLESALAVFLLVGLVPLIPVLRHNPADAGPRLRALRTALDRDFLLYFAATLSVMLGIYLFINADRFIAQSWFGVYDLEHYRFVDWNAFDGYQTAGLLARAVLWGTQPLLFVMFAQRSRLTRTTLSSLSAFWVYLVALFLGILLLFLFHEPICRFFTGRDDSFASSLVPTFAVAILPIGLLQGLGIFSLASRRYHECFVLGGCGVSYTVILYLIGRQPQLMVSYMFGGGLVCLMILFFIGVVRWGRKQP